MKKLNISVSMAAMLFLLSCGNADKSHDASLAAADSAAKAAPTETVAPEAPPMDSAAAAKAWETYAMPGDMQKWMASMDGKWKGEIISWPAPDAPPMPASEVKGENKMILGGRYQESTFKSKMMGMDFEGHGTLAYDNSKKVFVTTWIDNMGTGIMVLEGPYDESTKTITMTGKMTDPSQGKGIDVRQVVKFPDEKTQITEMYCNMYGKEFKNMEIKMTKN